MVEIITVISVNGEEITLYPGQYDLEKLEERFGDLDAVEIIDIQGVPKIFTNYGLSSIAEADETLNGLTAKEVYDLLDDTSELQASQWMDFSDSDSFFEEHFDTKAAAVHAVIFGNVSLSDPLVRFDGCRNLQTRHSVDYDMEFDDILRQWAEENL